MHRLSGNRHRDPHAQPSGLKPCTRFSTYLVSDRRSQAYPSRDSLYAPAIQINLFSFITNKEK